MNIQIIKGQPRPTAKMGVFLHDSEKYIKAVNPIVTRFAAFSFYLLSK